MKTTRENSVEKKDNSLSHMSNNFMFYDEIIAEGMGQDSEHTSLHDKYLNKPVLRKYVISIACGC